MAGKNLLGFLRKLEAEMQKSSQTYRNTVTNRKPHTLFITKEGLYNQVVVQAEQDGILNSREAIRKATDDFFTSVQNLAKKAESNKFLVVHSKRVSSKYVLITMELIATYVNLRGTTVGDTFRLVKDFYSGANTKFLSDMRKIYTKKGTTLKDTSFLDIGHGEQTSNIKERIYDELLGHGELPPNIPKIPELENIFVLKKDNRRKTIVVSLESSFANRLKGRTQERKIKEQLLVDLEKAIGKLESVATLSSSDSFVEEVEKNTINLVVNAVENAFTGSNVKIKKINVKKQKVSKTSQRKSSTLRKNAKILPVTKGKPAKKRKAPVKKSDYSIATFIGVLNQKLPQVVAKNMQPPALQYQTGRFASSVRITDISQTRQGFPSIGYTYQRDPYQVYELGNSRGTQERDPRRLIDKSIREIAAGMAIGRFYTRRM